jgi:chemotaxis protein methyltransferase CheR
MSNAERSPWMTDMTTPMADPAPPEELEDLEIELLLEGIWRRYGYDLRDYDRAGIRRRVQDRLRVEGLETATQLLERVLRDRSALDGLLDGREKTFESFFRPAKLWKALRRKAVPALRTYPSVRAWAVGGVPEGQLASLLLLFREELSRNYTIYATELRQRRDGNGRRPAFPRAQLRSLAKVFAAAGGRGKLSDYLENSSGQSRLQLSIQNHLVVASHNPATDASFNEFHLILARHAYTELSDALRGRVQNLIDTSLVRFGFLVLAPGETPAGMPGRYQEVDRGAGLFQKLAQCR